MTTNSTTKDSPADDISDDESLADEDEADQARRRSLRLTNDKIRNPGSLGANPKKKLPSKNAYPSLQITKEESDTSKGKHTKEWIARDHDVTPTAPTEDDETDPDAKPPNYDQSVLQHQRAGQQRSYVHFGHNIVQDVQPPMMATNGMWYPPTNVLQYPHQATGHIQLSKEWIEEQKENTRQMLEVRGIPPSVWDYYIEAPKDWASDDVDTIGVHNGVGNILMSQRSVRPWWVQDSSLGKMVELKNSFTKVVQAIEEVDRFIGEDMPEDSQLNSEYNRAEKRANKLHDRLQDACNELSTALVTPDHSFGYEFYDYISEFVEETRDNDKARKRVAEMKSRLSTGGIVTHQTNISTEQIKSQLPTFNGESSLSILDAVDTWKSILNNAGVHRQIWGHIILERIKKPALSSIPPTTKRGQLFDDICEILSQAYGGAIEVGHNIMDTHLKIGKIPDPGSHPEACLQIY